MARMDQHLHLGLDVLLAADAALVKREQEIEEQQRGNYGRLYLIMLFTLVVSALSVELLRRSMRQREALREGAARINAIVNNVVDGIVTVDEHGLIESFNPPASRMFGYPSAEVMGRHFSWLLDEPCRPRFQDYLERQAGGGQAGGGRECEELGLRADGSRFPMELAVSRMPMGERTMYVFIVRDITERHRAEENLRQAAGVFENTTEGILITLPDGTIVSVNPAFSAITGYTPQEVIGKTPRVLQSGRQERAFYRQMWESIKTAGHWQGEIWNRRKNGDIYPQWLNINAVRDHHGRTTHFVGITWDISELKASERLKDEFVATVSHELRTPLTSIRGSLGLINGGVAGRIPEQAAGLIRIAYDNCERLVRLINDLLDFEKMEAGKMSFQLRPVELMPLIHQAVQANQPYAAHYGVHLEVSEGPPGACVVADSDRLIQVMNNLLSNAAKYSPRDDVVEVSLQRRGRSLRVAVSDHGSGVPESFRPSVFKKFAQADASATRRKGGTGLGLRICKLIVERLGGEIGFDSEPNVRTTFYFDLPELRLEAGLPRGVELRELSLADRAEEERRQGAG
jgi:PAS domain S-box-containing protein